MARPYQFIYGRRASREGRNRGAPAFVVITFLVTLGVLQGQVSMSGVASHLVFLSAGIAFLGGAVLNWKTLKGPAKGAL